MIAIKDLYIDIFRAARLEAFCEESIMFLRKSAEEFCKGKSNDELLSFIDDTIFLAKNSSIARKKNIKKLMLLVIKYPDNLTPPQNELLVDRNLDEDYRLQRLESFLDIKNREFLVSTNTNLKNVRNVSTSPLNLS